MTLPSVLLDNLRTIFAADALAIAITHAHHRQSAALRLKVVGI